MLCHQHRRRSQMKTDTKIVLPQILSSSNRLDFSGMQLPGRPGILQIELLLKFLFSACESLLLAQRKSLREFWALDCSHIYAIEAAIEAAATTAKRKKWPASLGSNEIITYRQIGHLSEMTKASQGNLCRCCLLVLLLVDVTATITMVVVVHYVMSSETNDENGYCRCCGNHSLQVEAIHYDDSSSPAS